MTRAEEKQKLSVITAAVVWAKNLREM